MNLLAPQKVTNFSQDGLCSTELVLKVSRYVFMTSDWCDKVIDVIQKGSHDCRHTFAERNRVPGQSISTCLNRDGCDQCILDDSESVSAQPAPRYSSVHTSQYISFGTWFPCCTPSHNGPMLQASSHTEIRSDHTIHYLLKSNNVNVSSNKNEAPSSK